jgi:hypothetical protein
MFPFLKGESIMQKWEYKYTDSLTEGQMDELGEDGWELVSAVNITDYSIRLYFKRPID